ncbi:MAG: helix-turn-helix domain-containing protein [Candidatus Omnitrophica bacterium]|nr:helix-turn-helix domain-containing protein [Candidatus Omnitrophota bacterium]
MKDKLLTIQEVADYLRLNRFTVYRLAERGNLPGFKVTDQWRFKVAEVERWLEERKNHKQSRR